LAYTEPTVLRKPIEILISLLGETAYQDLCFLKYGNSWPDNKTHNLPLSPLKEQSWSCDINAQKQKNLKLKLLFSECVRYVMLSPKDCYSI